ncbi:MAG: hypothetical protein HN742_06045 [Lentisphaerae bacterium]|jgi:hypothetical protein|nr:hypothetical protein [Lentisphaerota bacterium]MBT4820644.1 hypothetical protein [Lentisphaerota bacterium]MBT5609640.1 hypothetical protein [Lentisphaerota bacterium]MBT7055240.1 hypothetical protein [Lentisphaerota bacterium]MBT7841412.1 hypothetical protein [Lentisphaerota bacterium]
MEMTRREMIGSSMAVAGAALLPGELRANTGAGQAALRKGTELMRPHLLVTARKMDGLRSLDELRKGAKVGHGGSLWSGLKTRAEADLGTDPIAGEGRNYPVVNATAKRILRHALAFLITQDERHRDGALLQMDATINHELWEDWRIPSQPANYPASLRMGQLGFAFGLAYDWLYPSLNEEERDRIVAGLHRLAAQPVLQAVDQGNWQLACLSNHLTCILGGTAVAAMAMGNRLPDADRLIDVATERLKIYLSIFGPKGEWNESIPYAVSVIYAVTFFSALRYWSAGGGGGTRENVVGEHPLTSFCRWMMYMTRPHGREAPLGNCLHARRVSLSYVPAVAAAAQDNILQWYYLENLMPPEDTMDVRSYPLEMVFYDQTLTPKSPEGRLPHGDVFPANTMCVSSRTNWDPRSTPCMVFGKGGAAYEVHGHNDIGQVCIDGHGEPLIVDLSGYHGDQSPRAPSLGVAFAHNVPVFNGQNMLRDRPIARALYNAPERRKAPPLRAEFLDSEFDDSRGGYWVLDTAAVYEGVSELRRTVVHLNPGVVAVLDEGTLGDPGDISLRWHPVTPCVPDGEGRFVVRGSGGACLAGRVVRAGDGGFAVARGEHKETGHSFVEATLHDVHFALLSLFCVFGPDEDVTNWEASGEGWRIGSPAGTVEVSLSDKGLAVGYVDGRPGWHVER